MKQMPDDCLKWRLMGLVLAALWALAPSASHAGDITWTNAGGGNFSNPLNWNPNQVPGTADRAVFNIETPEPYTVTWSVPVTNDNFYVAKGKVIWNLNGKRYEIIRTSGISVYTAGFGTSGQTLDMVVSNGYLNISTVWYRNVSGNTSVRMTRDVSGVFGRYDNPGIGAGSRMIVDGAQFPFANRIKVLQDGFLIVTNGGLLDTGSTYLSILGGGTVIVSGSGSYVCAPLGQTTTRLAGKLYIGQGGHAKTWGTAPASYFSGGEVTLDGGTLSWKGVAGIYSELSVLQGDGVVTSTFSNISGLIRPGGTDGAGAIKNVGNVYNYQNENKGTIAVELGGTAAGTYDRLVVIGTLYAGGTLDVSVIDGFKPAYKDSFDILDFTGAANGTFATVNLPGTAADWDLSQLYTTGVIRYIRPAGTVLMVK